MVQMMVRYTVEADELEPVEAAIREFVAAVSENEPDTVYRAYRLGDTRNFVHFMAFHDGEAEERHRTASYTGRFVEALYPRCEAPPVFESLVPIG